MATKIDLDDYDLTEAAGVIAAAHDLYEESGDENEPWELGEQMDGVPSIDFTGEDFFRVLESGEVILWTNTRREFSHVGDWEDATEHQQVLFRGLYEVALSRDITKAIEGLAYDLWHPSAK